MSINITSEVRIRAIGANLEALHGLLIEAVRHSAQGCDHIQRDECNGAIGAVVCLETMLDDAKALYRAAIALHRLRTV